jgi:hypothetical protein
MLRRNPDVFAIGVVVFVLAAVTVVSQASQFVVSRMNFDRHERLQRKVELIGQRVEEKAARIEQNANRIAEHIEREAQRHAERAERLAKVWE